ncbi:hypothetical protein Tco_1113947 [Tanacetum coccineum]|uniref:Uncharacterized protein n=1 Tax=Tanacetum coccineum TaxID=301880 RepID=A0ABQ5ITR4_9ASTR
MKMEILLEPTSNKLMVGDLCDSIRIKLVTTGKKRWCDSIRIKLVPARNPVKEILLKLITGRSSRIRRILKDGGEVGQDGSGGSGAGAVIGLSAAAGEGGAGVASQGSSRIPVSETRDADGREMGDGVPTQSSATGGASEWSFL